MISKITNEKGVTLTMLVITIVVLLIIATIMINISVGDMSLFKNAKITEFEESISAVKSKLEEKVVTKQSIEGKEDVKLTDSDKQEILKDYEGAANLTITDDNELQCTNRGSLTSDEKEILDKLGIK